MRYLLTGFLGLLFFSFFISCQKEVSLEFGSPSTGSLQSSAGDCLPKTVAGSYIANRAINDSNFIEVSVNVVTPGPYLIYTDSINGYSFKATGAFTSTGSNTVRLKGFGQPLASGVNNFTVVFDSSFCNVSVTVLPSGTGAATYTLSTAGTACASFAPSGNFIKDTTLDVRHKATVQVNVTALGSYSITTNMVNGYSFSVNGIFTSTGVQTVVLQGSGKPVAAGTNNFTVTAGTSTCTFNINVLATPPANAVFTLAGAPGACGSFASNGNYVSSTALTSSNTVTVGVTVTTTGSYSITTNTVNGYSFSSTGTFTTSGAQTVTLNSSGTPVAAGTNNFTVTAGGSTCVFSITVTAAPPPSGNHFPLTTNSWWSYDSPPAPGDSVKRVNNATASHNGNTYRVFEEFDAGGTSQWEYHYRRSGNDYFQWAEVDDYSIFTFDNTVEGDILFLKEGLATGATWMSAQYTGMLNNLTIQLRFSFICTDANATVTVNAKTFSNVYKINMKPQVSISGSAFIDEAITWTFYYADGIGLIYVKETDGSFTDELNIRNWQVF